MSAWMVGVDTGGTFTDLIAFDRDTRVVQVAKVASVPEDPSTAVLDVLRQLFQRGVAPQDIQFFVHGTTVATNALLEAKGATTGLMITRGFRAVYEARGWSQPHGADLVDTFYQKPPLLAPQSLTAEITERLDYEGRVVTPLDEDSVRAAARALRAAGVESIAVCFLFAFLNPAHERRTAQIIAEEAPGLRVALSSVVLPVIREYPRLSTTVIDAYVGPRIEHYLQRLDARLQEDGVATKQVFLMQSNGGLMRISAGARHPNQTLLSGPAAGVIAANALARSLGRANVLSFDMGGTSTDISVVIDGRVMETTEGEIARQDIGTPMLKVATLGAGGGTIAHIGKDGLLKVGPRSAGAMPGPACYGRGGTEPTVTDANLVLGVLSDAAPLAGTLLLDAALAHAAIETHLARPLGLDVLQAASGIIRIINTNMAVGLRLALQEQGQDPRRFTLIGFGGAGPLHAASLARSLGISTVLVPPHPGLNCATGLLQTDVRHAYLRSAVGELNGFPLDRMNAIFAELEAEALAEVAEEGFSASDVALTRVVDMRYLQQGYTLPVRCPAGTLTAAHRSALKQDFDELHAEVYGQSAVAEAAETVTFRVQSVITVPHLQPATTAQGDGNARRAWKGERPVFDVDAGRFRTAQVYQREMLQPGDRIAGPAVIDQFDATTLVLDGQTATVAPCATLVIEETGAA
jgi:N-methylhydantoinase A